MLVCGMALLAWPIVAVTSQSGVVQSESAEALELGSGNTLEASVDLKTSHPFQLMKGRRFWSS